MTFPIFIFHEIVLRLNEISSNIGRYVSNKPSGDTYLLTTTNGTLIIPTHFLEFQFKDPGLIEKPDLHILANNFKAV